MRENPEYKPRTLKKTATGNDEPSPEEKTPGDASINAEDDQIQTVGNNEQGIDISSSEDLWTVPSDVLVRHHGVPRTQPFSLNEPGLSNPIPIKYIDVMRRMGTGLDNAHERQIGGTPRAHRRQSEGSAKAERRQSEGRAQAPPKHTPSTPQAHPKHTPSTPQAQPRHSPGTAQAQPKHSPSIAHA